MIHSEKENVKPASNEDNLSVKNTSIQVFSQGPKGGRRILIQRYIYSEEGGGVGENVPLENL
jgi:hypothetical protein